jgi:hypothetical protein
MKKLIVLCIACLLAAASLQAKTISAVGIDIAQVMGAGAGYNAASGTITWAGGAAGWVLTDDDNFYFFDSVVNVSIDASISGITDLSSGGTANASFSSALWSINMTVSGYANPVASIAGHLYGNYVETEVDTDMLEGRAVVVVDTANFDDDYWTAALGQPIMWNGVGELAGIIANITLPYGTNYQSYAQSYTSENLIVTLYADENQIPEPATIGLLAFGVLSILRRKK